MTRPTLLVVALLALAGCQAENPAAPRDPFLFGPTRVPPPATGTITPQPGLSANRPATAALASAPAADPKSLTVSATPAPASASPAQGAAAGTAVTPVGDQVKIPDAARKLDAPSTPAVSGTPTVSSTSALSGTLPPSLPATLPSSTPPSGGAALSGSGSPGSSSLPTVADRRTDPSPAGQDRVVQTLLPRSQAGAGPPPLAPIGSAPPQQTPASSGGNKSPAVDIDDLPPAKSTGQPQTSYRPGTIQLVSGVEEIDRRYSYDPQYEWLRGKLEFSESDHHWKLRYIPVDGVTDSFGGSVILTDTPLLSGYERGDFVEVAGKLISASPDKHTFAPTYEVSQLKRLAN